jgi:hypothetical protein
MKIIINRLRWLTAGIYLGLALFAWLEQDSKKSKTTWNLIPSSPGSEAYEPSDEFSNYKHNHNKETTNA